jgi:Rieske Fe-S protein
MGIFDERGQVVSGPPPSALPQYQVSVENENVFVHLPEI